jgi:hypothetical protein
MVQVKLLVLDVLKPHEPSIIELSKILCRHKDIRNADIEVYGVDKKTEDVKITVEGKNLNYLKIKDLIEKQGAAIHSVDRVITK